MLPPLSLSLSLSVDVARVAASVRLSAVRVSALPRLVDMSIYMCHGHPCHVGENGAKPPSGPVVAELLHLQVAAALREARIWSCLVLVIVLVIVLVHVRLDLVLQD